MAGKRVFDDQIRAWVRANIGGQQTDLGARLEKARVVERGQPWVSKYVNDKGATATIDHLRVMAAFFERTLVEFLSDAGGRDLLRHDEDQRSAPRQGGIDVPASPPERADVLSAKDREIATLKARLSAVEDVAGQLLRVATGKEIPAPRERTAGARRSGRATR